jgi:Fic family protein
MRKESSILVPYKEVISSYRNDGVSYRGIAALLQEKYGLKISHNAVYSFLKIRNRSCRSDTLFYEGLPQDIQLALIRQITALWTYDSTAIEGNTLTLGETIKVLELGLTIGGKSLREHEEVYGHAKAIELIYDLLKKPSVEKEDLFNLHRCVMQKSAIDSMRPVGGWKREYNGTTGVRNGKPIYSEYASPADTPALMVRWLKEFNRKLTSADSKIKALNVYAWTHLTFVRIHPFFDGNGRVARLISNLPLLKCGHPPILISAGSRVAYIDALWNYQEAVGVLRMSDRLLPPHQMVAGFKDILEKEWREVCRIVDNAKLQAQSRSTD